MTRLRDIMTEDVITIAPEMTIRDAMNLLSTRHITGVPVIAGGEIVGVITSTDLMAFAADLPGAPTEREGRAELAAWAQAEEQEEGELEPPGTYFTELWDDAGADATVRFDDVGGPEWSVLDDHTVAEAMTRAPICRLPGDTMLPAAADFMRVHDVHRVLVTDGEVLQGIVTATDIARAVADHKLGERTYVFGDDRRFHPRGWGLGDKQPHPEVTLGDHLPHADRPKES